MNSGDVWSPYCYLSYAYNPQQISNIADTSYRTESTIAKTAKQQNYSYDANGNLLCVITGTKNTDGKLIRNNERKLLWDEENRLLALSDNGFVSNYWYDAAGERTVKTFGDAQGVSINGLTSAATTGTTNFTAYISPYLVVSNGGYYSKHVYIGSQRITSKLGSSDIFASSPVNTTDLQSKYTSLTAKIKDRYDSLGVVYRGTPQGSAGLITSAAGRITTPLKYFYHSDHLGSSSLITDAEGNVTQHIEYVPFGEVFVEERNNSWSTPYKFNAKELDEETGLYYYGARYYNPRTSVWLSVDPLMTDYLNVQEFDNVFNSKTLNGYCYANQNPVAYIDYEGGLPIPIITGAIGAAINTGINVYQQASEGSFDIGSGKTWAKIGAAAGSGFIAGATGNIAVAMTANAVGSLADQMISNGGDFSKVNITSVAVSVALGVTGDKMARILAKSPLVKGVALNLADRLSPYLAKSPTYVLGRSSFYIKTGTTPSNYYSSRAANVFGSTTSNASTGILGLKTIPDYFRVGYSRWFKNKDGKNRNATVSFGTLQVVQIGDRKIANK